jgi:hypothetical protein
MSSSIHSLLSSLNAPHIIHADILPFIERLKNADGVEVNLEGNSFEGLGIYRLTFGKGPIEILAWTQMHGNEATATASVFDLLDQLLAKKIDSLINFEDVFTLHIVPMLNPDGAQRCIRHNAQAIDINRDAMAQQTPEGRILMRLVDELSPDVGFNLHDQSPYYQCGKNGSPSTIAFLAPAFNHAKDIDNSRSLAMSLIGKMTESLQHHIPNCIARYDDTFSPRSFGDRIAQKKVSTILIESGAARNDPNRQVARQMNVLAMKVAFEMLGAKQLGQIDTLSLKQYEDAYWQIPENTSETFSSLLLKDLHFVGTQSYQASVSIKQTARYSNEFFIDAVGDLSSQAGLVEFDASDLSFDPGLVHSINSPSILTNESYRDWLRKGVIQFQGEVQLMENQSDLPMLYNQPLPANARALCLQQPAYFLMRRGDEIVAAVVNGQLIQLN